ncbi:MAG: hypothetical protein KAS15_03510, partial [Nanoarchaeota archaeon]|nr:hypothetical protein [Nanoarchaeota archaeon]
MSNNLCDTGIKERICQIFSVEKNLNSETKDFGFRNNLTLDYLIDKLPIQENADNIRDTILKDYLFCKTGSVSGNVVNNLIEVLASQNPVNYNNEMQDSIVINPNILIAANNYLDIIKNEKVIKIIEKANQKEHLKTVIFLDEIYSRLDDEFAGRFIEESQNIEECAVLVSRYSKELSALSKSDSNLKSAYQILNKFSSDFSLKDIK